MDFSKAALNIWCSKKKLRCNYDYGTCPSGFRCQIEIDTISHVAAGDAANKKTASNRAAMAMLVYLIEKKYITRQELSQPCYQTLDVCSKLFPGGVQLTLEQLRKEQGTVSVEYSSTKGSPFPAQSSFSNSTSYHHQPPQQRIDRGPPKEDWWDMPPGTSGTNKSQDPEPMMIDSDDMTPPSGASNLRVSPNLSRFRGPRPGPYAPTPPPAGPSNGNRYFDPRGPSAADPRPRWNSNQYPPPNNSYPMAPSWRLDRQEPPQFDWIDRNAPQPVPPPPGPSFASNPQASGNWRRSESSPNFQNSPANPTYNESSNGIRRAADYPPDHHHHHHQAYRNAPADNRASNLLNNMFNRNDDNNRKNGQTSASQQANNPTVGNFTLENAKQQLYIFMNANRIKGVDYEYNSWGPPHRKTFSARMRMYFRGREIIVTKQAGTKQDASRYCALDVMQQLFREGFVDKYEPDAPSNKQLLKNNVIYHIKVSTELREVMINMYHTVQSYNQVINPGQSAPIYGPSCVKYYNPLAQPDGDGPKPNQPSYMYWCPPLPDYNPWINTKPDDPLYAGKSMEDINVQLEEQFQTMVNSEKFQRLLEARKKLPIYLIRDDVLRLTREHSVLIIKGSTGCGKTTQVPQFILDSFLKQRNGANCNIIVTQPRRISAISISERIAYERLETIGSNRASVGYAVRFEHVYPRPYGSILFCTTGHLLRRIQGGLKGVSHLIIDEVHERDTSTDLLLVIIRDLIRIGLDLKVVIMSATIGVSRFQKYFDNCHVLEIDGALFPVQRYFIEDAIEIIKWDPKQITYIEEEMKDLTDAYDRLAFERGGKERGDDDDNRFSDSLMDYDQTKRNYSQRTLHLMGRLREGLICLDLVVAILEYIENLFITGAVLIFLPGWSAIFELLTFLQQHRTFGNKERFLLLPLHSQLSCKENHRVFESVPQRKIILSTNIAETSITIDDVVFVIDSCLLKRKVFCPRSNVTSHIIDWVSKSNLQQRQGRAGRVRSGYFFALCSRKRFESFEEFKVPEILVTSLVETAILVKYLGFGDVPEFMRKCLDPPPHRTLMEGIATLRNINAFDQHDNLTPLGNILVKLPIDPRLGRMVMLAVMLGVAGPVLTIAAAVASNYELFDLHSDAAYHTMKDVDKRRYSDHLILFKVFQHFERASPIEQREMRELYNMSSLNHIMHTRRQLLQILTKGCGLSPLLFVPKPTYTDAELDTITGLTVAAFYPNVCAYRKVRLILTNETKIGLIHKASVMHSYIVIERSVKRPDNLPSPIFVYTEKSANKNLIIAKQMTMVSFMQLLLFGVRNYEFPVDSSNDTVVLDGWLEVKIDAQVFDCCWVIKTELENILSRVCHEPPALDALSHIENGVINSARAMCSFSNVSVDLAVNPLKTL